MEKHYPINKDYTLLQKISEKLKRGDTPCLVTGLSPAAKAFFIGSLCPDKPSAVVCRDEATALKLIEDLETLFGKDSAVFIPARDFNFRSGEVASREYELGRLSAIYRILRKNVSFAVFSAECLLQPIIPPDVFKENTRTIRAGETISQENLIELLVKSGYSRRTLCDGVGEFSVRGGIVDFFPAGYQDPVRLEFFGDDIDSLSFFSKETQRRGENIDEVLISPCSEILYDSISLSEKIKKLKNTCISAESDAALLETGEKLGNADKYISLIYQKSCLLDYFQKSNIFIIDPSDVNEAMMSCYKGHLLETEDLLKSNTLSSSLTDIYRSPDEIYSRISLNPTILLDTFARSINFITVKSLFSSETTILPKLPAMQSEMLEEIKSYKERDIIPVLFCGTEKTVTSMLSFLSKEGIRAEKLGKNLQKGILYLSDGVLSGSFLIKESSLALLSMSGVKADKGRKKRFKKSKEISELSELVVGEAVVHAAHGIGIFDGITKIKTQNIQKDYIKIKYSGADVLYVPVSGLDLVSKYVGPGSENKLKLNKLSGVEWSNTKKRVRQELSSMADELIALYKKRMETKGHSFAADSEWQREFEEKFEYEETDDQLRSIKEIKSDMEAPRPMDRLLCGDVGFGKTEVAFRAAFKCVLDGKQVALLAPTTLLAFQHYQTALQRFDGYPIKIELLSRFRSPKEQREILKKLKSGAIDILIGTHRLIGSDVSFKDLGLLIVDEEQRFGVRHKEKLKEKFVGVDVLTLSATPIPRTLNMALSGIRDMSMIEEPPKDRLPVQTFVVEEDDAIIADVLHKELRRGGSAFYLHNRVESIHSTAAKIARLVPEARIGIAHGKMAEDDLSAVFESLVEGEIDVLVCTTIIETGIDLPNCNTLIIEDADKMGLAQLYQIRGRVGRSSRRAYAYFLFKPQKVLTEVAAKRLSAIRDFTQFGSGFKIAMRDLEIRGAGSILGARQHGHMENVGYDMYIKLLKQAVAEKQGEKTISETADCLIDIRMNSFIPPDYIESEELRMEVYKLIASVDSEEAKSDVIDELIDRFGEPTPEVLGLIDVALYRKKAMLFGVTEIKETADAVTFYVKEISMEKIEPLVKGLKNRLLLNAGAKPYLQVKKFGSDGLSTIIETFNTIKL